MKPFAIPLTFASFSLIGLLAAPQTFAASSPPTPPSGHFGYGGGFEDLSTLPSVLKISQATLQKDLQAGQTILQIAESQKISETTLISKMESAEKKQLNKLVSSNKMTAAQETQMLQQYDANIKKMITQKMQFHSHGNPPQGN